MIHKKRVDNPQDRDMNSEMKNQYIRIDSCVGIPSRRSQLLKYIGQSGVLSSCHLYCYGNSSQHGSDEEVILTYFYSYAFLSTRGLDKVSEGSSLLRVKGRHRRLHEELLLKDRSCFKQDRIYFQPSRCIVTLLKCWMLLFMLKWKQSRETGT